MSPAIAKIFEQIDGRVLRERALIFITILALIFLVWNFLVQARFDSQRASLQAEAETLKTEQQALISQISSLTAALATDPAVVKTNEITKLTASVNEIESRLSGLSQGLISAERLPKVLEDVLNRTTKVTLLQVRTLEATEIQLANDTQAQNSPSETNSGTGVFKHGVLIRVSGTYSQLIQLMTEIESLQWKFYWESLDYTVSEYPNAEVDIRVFTLSSEEGLFGV